jgi:AraC-like DNA-binding protein
MNWNEASSRLSPTPGPFARENLVYVQETGYFETEPGYFTERSGLDSLLMILTIAGQGQVLYHGQTWTLAADSLLWLNCREYHLYKSCPNSAWKFYWVHFTGASSWAYYQLFIEQSHGQPVINLNRDSAQSLARLFGKLIGEQTQHGLAVELLSAQFLVEMMTSVVLHESEPHSSRQNQHPAVSAALAIMENHLSGGLNLSDLAAQVHVSRFYLIKLFVRQTGLTPMDYWQQIRLSEAKRLLHQTDWTIERIADAVGLVPASHLISVFRRMENMTPGQYRRHWRDSFDLVTGSESWPKGRQDRVD